VRARFSAPVQTGTGAHPASYTMGTGSFLGLKRPGRGVDHLPPSTAGVKETVDLYSYSSGPSWPVIWWPLPFTFTFTITLLCYCIKFTLLREGCPFFVVHLVAMALSNKNPASSGSSHNNFRNQGQNERAASFGIVRRARKIANWNYWLRHVCPSVWNNSAPTWLIFIKSDIWIFFEILL